MQRKFKKGLYKFSLVVEREGDTETITLYRNIKSRPQVDIYSQALLDLCDMQGIKWKSVEWILDELN